VTVVAFDAGGARMAGVSVSIDDVSGVTGEDGVVRLSVPAGAHDVRIGEASAHASLSGSVDVIATFDGAWVLDVDAPAADPADAVPAPAVVVAEQGELVLRVVDDAAAPIAGASCAVRGTGNVGVTDASGMLRVALPAGEALLSIVHPRFAPGVARGVVVAGEARALEARLLPAAHELDELTVRAPHLAGSVNAAAAERRGAAQVVEVLGGEQMTRSGDSDAAAALKRASGLTVVGGRYAYVRGLGDRYSTTLLNGAQLPSPEPERRVVPLDMFPTSLLSGIVVQKTWSPSLPGDFGGGAVLLQSRAIPEKRTASVSVTGSGVIGTMFHEGPQAPGGALDFLGVDDGTRALPPEVRDASNAHALAEGNQFSKDGYTKQELERFGEQLSRTWSTTPQLLLPGMTMNAAYGDVLDLGPLRIGGLIAGTAGNDVLHTKIERNQYVLGGDGLTRADFGVVDAVDRSTSGSAVLALGGTLFDHRVQSTTLLNRTTDDETRVFDGVQQDVNTRVRATRLRWVERMLLTEQLEGTHPLPLFDAELAWRYGYALATRGEPDQRESRTDLDAATGKMLLSDRPESNQRLFSSLTDHAHDMGVTLRAPIPVWLDEEATLSVGGAFSSKSREVDTRRFKLVAKGLRASDVNVRALPPELAFAPENIGADGFLLNETTRSTDNYSGSAHVGGAFVELDLPILPSLSFSGGARLEAAAIHVETFELFNPGAPPVVADLGTFDVLPGGALTWRFVDTMQLRLAGAMTVTRPELRELSPAVFTDVTGGRSRFGNPALQAGSIGHLDARWEWDFGAAESLSVATFGKRFERPIERVIQAGSDQAITFANALGAWNVGVEVEGRVGLGRVLPWLDGFTVGGNGALIFSRVDLSPDGIATSKERPLEGQSPWVLNANVGYANDDIGLQVSALYNVFGPRVSEVGVLGLPDIYEEPLHQLDVVARQQLPFGLALTLKAQNLVDGASTRTQGGNVVERFTRGRTISAGLAWAL
jgi:hypothetical protein